MTRAGRADFDGAMTPEATFRDLQSGDAGWLIQQHAEYYSLNDGFDASFEALVAEILADFIRNRDPDMERAWIAHRGNERLGSVFCVRGDGPGVAKLRLFYLVPAARGLGLGRQMLTLCTDFARARGYDKMVLWTHESHAAACALYDSFGFEMTASRPVHSFGQPLVEQNWEIAL